jgi:PAS domain S-box-containing protein
MIDQLSNFIQLNPLPTIAINTDLKIVSANHQFYRLVAQKGFDEGEVTSLKQIISNKEHQKKIKDLIWDDDNQRNNFEFFTHLNELKVMLEFDISQPFIFDDKAVKLITIKDRTENYQTIQKLRHNDEKYEALVSSMPDMLLMNGQTGDYLFYVNPEQFDSHEGFLTVDPEFDNLPLPAGIKKLTLEAFERYKKTGEPQILKSFIENSEGELRIFESKIAVDSSNRLISVSRDVTEQKLLEIKLQNSESRLRMALEINNDGIFDWNIYKDTVYFSKSWKTALGYNDDEIVNEFSSWEKLVHPDDLEHTWAELIEHLNGKKEIYAVDFRMKTKSGEFKWIHARGKVIERDAKGKALRMLGTHTDISSVRSYEQELVEKNRMLEEFANIATHKLRRPVANLKGIIELSRMENDEINLIQYIDQINQSVSELDQEILGMHRAIQLAKIEYLKPEVKIEKNKVIYLIDDDKINNSINEKILKRLKMTTIVFKNMQEPLDYISKGFSNPDLILFDVYLESDDGWAFLDSIKKLNIEVCIIVLTSILHADDIDRFKKYPFVRDVWQKPLSLSMIKQHFKL